MFYLIILVNIIKGCYWDLSNFWKHRSILVRSPISNCTMIMLNFCPSLYLYLCLCLYLCFINLCLYDLFPYLSIPDCFAISISITIFSRKCPKRWSIGSEAIFIIVVFVLLCFLLFRPRFLLSFYHKSKILLWVEMRMWFMNTDYWSFSLLTIVLTTISSERVRCIDRSWAWFCYFGWPFFCWWDILDQFTNWVSLVDLKTKNIRLFLFFVFLHLARANSFRIGLFLVNFQIIHQKFLPGLKLIQQNNQLISTVQSIC